MYNLSENKITIDAAVLGELSAETLARIKAEDGRNFDEGHRRFCLGIGV
jgi:hypothetical protein